MLQVPTLFAPLLRRMRPLRPRDSSLLPGLRQFSEHATAGIRKWWQCASNLKFVTLPKNYIACNSLNLKGRFYFSSDWDKSFELAVVVADDTELGSLARPAASSLDQH